MLGDTPYSLLDSRLFKAVSMIVIAAMLSTFIPFYAIAQSKTVPAAPKQTVATPTQTTPSNVLPTLPDTSANTQIPQTPSNVDATPVAPTPASILQQIGSPQNNGNTQENTPAGIDDSNGGPTTQPVAPTSGAVPSVSSLCPRSFSLLGSITSGLKSFACMLGRGLESLLGSGKADAATISPTVTSITPSSARSGTSTVSITICYTEIQRVRN